MSEPTGTTTDTAPEATDTPEDADASAALATAQEAGQKSDPAARSEPDEDELDPKIKAKIEKANREAQGLRKRLKELEPLAAKAKELEDAKKSELDKLNEQLAAAHVKLQGFEVAAVRSAAAVEAGLDPSMAEFITAVDEETALEQARKLAKHLTPPEPPPANFRQGVRPNPAPKHDGNDLLRRLAGHPQ